MKLYEVLELYQNNRTTILANNANGYIKTIGNITSIINYFKNK